jgi:hypothetical protein
MPDLAPAHIGPAADRLFIAPTDDGGYRLDVAFDGDTGYRRAEHHVRELTIDGIPHTLRQETDGAWCIRFDPLSPVEVARALNAFLR